jgi:hypothetical protein
MMSRKCMKYSEASCCLADENSLWPLPAEKGEREGEREGGGERENG